MHRGLAATLLSVLVLGLGGCSGGEEGGAPVVEAPAQPVGLKAIRERGELRLLTRNNGVSYHVLKGRRFGFDYELAQRFADAVGVKLEVIVPANWGDLIPMLRAGEGDIVGAGMNVTPGRQQQVAFAEPYALTHMRVVWGKGRKKVEYAEELSARRVHVRQHSAYYDLLVRLSGLLAATGQKPIDIVIEGETLETEQILLDVAAGKIPYTLCDYHICLEAAAAAPELILGPPVSEPAPLAWAVHPDAKDLLAEVNEFLKRQRTLDLAALYKRYYEPRRGQAEKRLAKIYVEADGTISRFDDAIRSAAEKYELDWRLLVSLAYEESRFDPKASTPTAGRGLFGMLPGTARKLGFKDITDPVQAAEAAAAYVSSMRGQFAQLPKEEERLKLAVASYQAGVGHVADARILASQEGLNPDVWDDIAKVLPLLSLREYAAKAEHGYVRGAETVDYVTSVWERFRAYRHARGERDRRPRGK